jgi:adenylate cyclase
VNRLEQLIAELKRRRVIRALVVWSLATFAVLQVYEPVMHGLHLPDWTLSFVVVLLVAGFPLTAGLAWVFDLRSTGIERTAPAAAPAAAPSIAVLPFADMSPGKDQDYFCEGVAEELLGALCGISNLRVAARSSSFQFKGRAMDSRDVARLLGVAHLLEGSVRKAGSRLRITAQLVSQEGYQLWSETFERGLEDVFAIQQEIAQAVVRALRLQLSSQEQGRLVRSGTRAPQAYDMYLRGRQHLMAHGDSGLRAARQMFKGALELDGQFAQAWAGLADANFMMLQWHLDVANAASLQAEALQASEEALRLEPGLAEAHVARANALSVMGRTQEAERDFQRAIALNPAYSDACYFYARSLVTAGRLDDAARMFEEAVRRNPDDYASLSLLVGVHRGRGDPAAAADVGRRALAAVDRRLRFNPDDVRALYLGAGNDVQYGDRARGLERLARAIELMPEDFSTLYNAACVYAGAGETGRALDLFDRAVATGRGSRQWMEHDSDLDVLRSERRFQEIMARVRA